MKKLLIHSNNTSFNNTELFPLAEQFVFDVDFDKDVDFYVNENLTNGGLKQKLEKCDIVFIKVSLSKNYLEYLGLRLAYHIRLTKSIGTKAYLPIVFIAEESLQYLGLTHPEPSILFTTGIYLIKESLEDYQKTINCFNEGKIKTLDNIANFVSSVSINPPANYLSHHSIANEWSILRWAKVLGISTDREALKDVRNNIESLLYFKYLQTKYPIETEPDEALFRINGKGRILYIDDEWNKGWNLVLQKLVSISPGVNLETFNYDFKDRDRDEIIIDCEKKIKDSNPDLVFLDLRLSDSDFDNKLKTNELTGYKVLKIIKSINPGIQVIIFTASNKVWHHSALQNSAADGFIIKESPENSITSGSTLKAIGDLISIINKCLARIYLKEFYVNLDILNSKLIPRKNYKKSDAPLPKEFVDESLKWFELSCEVLRKDTSQSMMTASFLFMFSVLENLSNRLINVENPIPIVRQSNQQLFWFEFRGTSQKLKRFQDDEKNIGFYRRTNGHLKTTRNIPWKFKILNALDFITDNKMKEEELSVLIKKRNDLVHANSTTGDIFTINIDLLVTLNSIIFKGLSNVK